MAKEKKEKTTKENKTSDKSKKPNKVVKWFQGLENRIQKSNVGKLENYPQQYFSSSHYCCSSECFRWSS